MKVFLNPPSTFSKISLRVTNCTNTIDKSHVLIFAYFKYPCEISVVCILLVFRALKC